MSPAAMSGLIPPPAFKRALPSAQAGRTDLGVEFRLWKSLLRIPTLDRAAGIGRCRDSISARRLDFAPLIQFHKRSNQL